MKGQTVHYVVRCTDAAGNVTASAEQTELIDSINDAPQITSFSPVEPRVAIEAGACLSFTVAAIDDDNDPLEHTWTLEDASVSTEASYIYCREEGDSEEHTVAVLVTDGALTAVRSWLVTTEETDCNLWNNPDSDEGIIITSTELQEAIHYWLTDQPIPGTDCYVSSEMLQELIHLWLTG
jgi:hypothetical protein